MSMNFRGKMLIQGRRPIILCKIGQQCLVVVVDQKTQAKYLFYKVVLYVGNAAENNLLLYLRSVFSLLIFLHFVYRH